MQQLLMRVDTAHFISIALYLLTAPLATLLVNTLHLLPMIPMRICISQAVSNCHSEVDNLSMMFYGRERMD